MDEYIWSAVLYDKYGNMIEQLGIVRAPSQDQAAMWGLRLAKSKRPDMPAIATFGARLLSELRQGAGTVANEEQ